MTHDTDDEEQAAAEGTADAERAEFLRARAEADKAVFTGPMGEIVLADLARFCRAAKSTYAKDPRDAAQLDGRREVFLRISEHVEIPVGDLLKLYHYGKR